MQISFWQYCGSIAATVSGNIAAILPLAAILQLSEYASFGNKFILQQYFDFDKGSVWFI